jgi:two-component system, LytTR family, response regulator
VLRKDNYFFMRSDYKIVKVIFDEIIYVEALQKYVRIHTLKKRIVTLTSMSQLEAGLPTNKFYRIRHSHIINIDKIESVEGNLVQLGIFSLPISKGQREGFLELIKRKGI